jgi:hypothetical protein
MMKRLQDFLNLISNAHQIHGAWFDPSNPVVKMSGALRSDLYADLLECEKQTDLVLAVGTSLCGMNADRIVSSAAERAAVRRAAEASLKAEHKRKPSFSSKYTSKASEQHDAVGETLGSVIVSIQKTVHDKFSSLRIFGLIDDVMSILTEELGIDTSAEYKGENTTHTADEEDVFLIPYGPPCSDSCFLTMVESRNVRFSVDHGRAV